jgi:hypothetical protein
LALGWRCVPVCRTSAERTSTRPSSKQRLAPRLPVWCSKVALNGSTRRKAGTRLGPVPILFVLLVELPVSGRYWPCTIVRVFYFCALSHEKGHIFGLWGSLWRVFGSNTEEIFAERSCFMYEKVLGWFWWSGVAVVTDRF